MSQAERDSLYCLLDQLTPTEKLDVVEHVLHALRPVVEPEPDGVKQRHAMLELLEEMKALPVNNPDDGFSSRDHDAVLYPKKP